MSMRILFLSIIISLFFAVPAFADEVEATASPEPVSMSVKFDFGASEDELFVPPFSFYVGSSSNFYYYDASTSSFVKSSLNTVAESGSFTFSLSNFYKSDLTDNTALILYLMAYPDFSSWQGSLFGGMDLLCYNYYSFSFHKCFLCSLSDFGVSPTTSPNSSISSSGFKYSNINAKLRFYDSVGSSLRGLPVYLGGSFSSRTYGLNLVSKSYDLSAAFFSYKYDTSVNNIYKSDKYMQSLLIPYFQYKGFTYAGMPDDVYFDKFTMSITSDIPIYLYDDVTDQYYRLSAGGGNTTTLGDGYTDLSDGTSSGLQPVDPEMSEVSDSLGSHFIDLATDKIFYLYDFESIWGCDGVDHYIVNDDGNIEFYSIEANDGDYHMYPKRDLGVYLIDNGYFTVQELANGFGVSVSTVINRYLNDTSSFSHYEIIDGVSTKVTGTSGGIYSADELYAAASDDIASIIYTRLGYIGRVLLSMDSKLVDIGTYLSNISNNLYTELNYMTGTMNTLLSSINKKISNDTGVDLTPVTDLLTSIDFNTQYTLNAISNWEQNLATDMTDNMTSWFNNVLYNQGVINDNMMSYIADNTLNLQYVLNAINNWKTDLSNDMAASDSWFGNLLSYQSDIYGLFKNWVSDMQSIFDSLQVDVTVENDSGSIWDTIRDFIVGSLLDKLVDTVADGLKAAFVPSDDYFSNKFNSWLQLLPVKGQMDTYLGLTVAVAGYATEDRPSFKLGDTFGGVASSVSAKRQTFPSGSFENMAVTTFDQLTAQVSDVDLIDFSVFDDYKPIINAVLSAVLIYGFVIWTVHQLQKSFDNGGEG